MGLWECEKLLKSERDMFLEYLVSFLDRRTDLRGSDFQTIKGVLREDISDFDEAY